MIIKQTNFTISVKTRFALKSKKCFALVVGLLVMMSCYAQELAPISVFNPEDYGAEPQNWSISQSSNNFIYIANNKGLLEFNGNKWALYESPNSTNLRAVKVINDIIYSGGYQDFGFWVKDNFGKLKYTSLSKELKVRFLEDEEFWNIAWVGNTIIFQSLDRLHIYNPKTKSYSIVDPKQGIARMFKVDNKIYFQTSKNDLYKLEAGKPTLIYNHVILNDVLIINMFESRGKVLAITEKHGVFEISRKAPLVWKKELNVLLKNYALYSAIQLAEGGFVLGTISNGVIKISEEGEIGFKIDQISGLSNSTVLNIFEDKDDNIWLGLNEGINCISIKSPYRRYFDSQVSLGSVYVSKVFNGTLYVGTNQGLFFRPLKDKTQSFRKIDGTQGQVWFLDVLYGTLFCGHNRGTYVVNGHEAKKISSIDGAWIIKKIPGTKNLLLQGDYDGLSVLELKNGVWSLRNKIKNFNISSRYLEFLDSYTVFVNHEYKGVFKIELDKGYKQVKRILKESTAPKGLYSSLVKYQGDILYAYKNGILKYDSNFKKFKKDNELSSLIPFKNFSSAKLVVDEAHNRLWSFNKASLRYLTVSSVTGAKTIISMSFPNHLRKDLVGFESIMPIADSEYLLGSRNGYFTINLKASNTDSFKVFINEIDVNQLKNEDHKVSVSLNSKGDFENDQHNLNFRFSIPEYHAYSYPEYSYKLEGIYNNWTEWTSSGEVFFENLPYGNYTFKVKGRIGNQDAENIAVYSFTIARPWYISYPMLLVYVLVIALFSFFMHQYYKAYYKKQRDEFLAKKNRELELKELENKQQLMNLKNENLQQEIDNKNRELGISTMSLIKKNETLNELRRIINTIQDLKDLKKVSKIIDDNLSDKNDWKVFEEAFNNADKDFLKKLKSLHPDLTSNDLRLCAYLRLNLSSKEIAPLLSISPKSVEVKRYRLRKKLNLEHEDGLIEYILQL